LAVDAWSGVTEASLDQACVRCEGRYRSGDSELGPWLLALALLVVPIAVVLELILL